MSKLRQLIKEWRGILIIAPSVACIVILGEFWGFFQVLEWEIVDRFIGARPPEPADERIVIVAIDESDITYVGKWPVPDRVMARLLKNIKAQQPKAIGIDIYRDLPVEPGHQELVKVFETTPNLIGVEKIIGTPVAAPPTLKQLHQVAMSDMILDADGKVRRALISVVAPDGEIVLGLGARLALTYLEGKKITPELIDRHNQYIKLGQTIIKPLRRHHGGYVRGDTGGYQILLNYRGVRKSFRILSMKEVLENKITSGVMRDRIVLIGATAPSLNDLFQTPYSNTLFAPPVKTAGVVIHANIASQILSAALEGRPLLQVWPNYFKNLWIITWAFVGAAGIWHLLQTGSWGKNLFFGSILITGVCLVGGSYLAFISGWILPVISPLVALFSSGIATAFYYERQELKIANEQLKKAKEKLEEYSHNLELKVEERTQELEKAKKAALAASAAKSEFLSNMSHELRTPLNGILGYAQILHRDKSLTDKQRDGIRIIEKCGSYLLTLINEVLDLSKIEARKMELHPKDFHFPSFLESVVQICRVKAEQKDIAFTFLELNQLPLGIYADEKRLRQVLINLLGNAIKFTDKGGVTLKVEVLENRSTPDNTGQKISRIRFEIEDTGVGMRTEQLEKIFLPFEQVGDSDRKVEGTGLGLAISKKIVQMMESQLEVKSDRGVGSTFWFELDIPLSTEWIESAPTSFTKSIVGYKGDRKKILVIDDRWENRSVLVNLLKPIGFETMEAENGKEGLEQAIAVVPDLIATDLMMPEMDGFEMIRRLRKISKIKDVPAIAISASVFEFDKEKSRLAGYNDFLSKPVQAVELLERLQKYLSLEWIYETEEELSSQKRPERISSTEEIVVPPSEHLVPLYQAAQIGDIEVVEQAANQLKQLDVKYVPFATKLLQLAAEFEDAKIVKLIEPYMGDKYGNK